MENYSLHDYISILMRRKVEFLVTFGVLLLGAVIFSAMWSTYRTSATIQIQAPDIPEGVTAPMGANAVSFMEALADQRIQQIQQKVTATSTLVEIITKFNLYQNEREISPITEVVEKMRKKIKLDLVSTELSNPASASRMSAGQLAAIAFTITFKYTDPHLTQQVTDELVSRFLDEDLKQRRTKARETAAFLATQIETLERSMAEQEGKVADFRRQHPHSRPEALVFNQQMAATTGVNLQDIDRQLNALEQSRGALRSQLASVDPYSRVIADGQVLTTPAIQLKALQSRYSTLLGQYGASHPDVVKLGRQIDALRAESGVVADGDTLSAQIADMRANLVAAERTYGTNHPDVTSLRSQLRALERQAASADRVAGKQGTVKKDADNPAYLMLVSQLQAADSQFQALSAQRDALRKQREHYERLVAETPMVEQEYAALARDYDNSQLRYREMKEKKQAADMNEQMEQGRKAERLVVIESAELPTRTNPPRPLLLAAGMILSVVGGFGAVAAAEAMSRSIHGTYHLASLVGVPPLVAVPLISTEEERNDRRRLQKRAVIAASVAVLVVLVVIDRAVMPLDVLSSVIANRLGLF